MFVWGSISGRGKSKCKGLGMPRQWCSQGGWGVPSDQRGCVGCGTSSGKTD